MARASQALPDFAPESLLDLCAGPGTASLAAVTSWPSIRRATLLDTSAPLIDAARRLGRSSGHFALRAPRLLRADLGAALGTLAKADLVTMSYALVELPETTLAETVRDAFALASGLLVLVEPGTPEGTRRVLAARQALIAAGAHIVAPCPHALACPMPPPAWCHFVERLARSRAHLRAKAATVPFEDEPYSFIAAARRPGEPVAARLVGRMRLTKVEARAPACMADGTLGDIAAPRRDREAYARLRRLDWGDTVG
jgi:ribosomal protein RSM22 (predicted rRNA methylase)